MDEYQKTGRGGAGNFHCQKDLEVALSRDKEDVEAQKHVPSTESSSSGTLNQQYAHTGRGGAGNWYSPRDLQETGEFVGASNSEDGTAARKETASVPTYRGRGGAGNFVSGSAEADEKGEREREVGEDVSKKVQKDVEAGLAQPQKAYLGP